MSESALTPAETPLWQRRTPSIQAGIDATFARFAEGPPSGYRFLGTSNAYHWRTINQANSLLLTQQLEHEQGRKIDVLDVGAGFGHFVRGLLANGHNAVGITANDYREFDTSGTKIPDENYCVGDAHYLHELLDPQQQFDLVVSRWTLRHLNDRLSVLEQMADKVRAGGILAFDEFRWNPDVRRNVGFGVIATALRSSGFILIDSAFARREIIQDKYASAVESIWQRVEVTEPVRFPIDYDTYGLDLEVVQDFRYVRIEQ